METKLSVILTSIFSAFFVLMAAMHDADARGFSGGGGSGSGGSKSTGAALGVVGAIATANPADLIISS